MQKRSIRASWTLAFGVAACLAAVGTAPAQASGSTARDKPVFDLKARAARSLMAAATPSATDDHRLKPDEAVSHLGTKRKPAARIERGVRVTDQIDLARTDTGTATSTTSAVAASSTAATDCPSVGLQLNELNDSVWVTWNLIDEPVTVYRMRYGGSWAALGTTSENRLLDRTNTDGLYTYRVVTQQSGLTCDLGDWWSMQTANGWGWVDGAFGESPEGALLQQNEVSWAERSTTLRGADPTFSPDGRRVATVTYDPVSSAWGLLVETVRTGAEVYVDFMPTADHLFAEPAFSPDGRYLAYTQYQINPDSSLSAVGLHVINLLTKSDVFISGSQGLIQPDWKSSTTLVAASEKPGEGLFTLPVAGGTPAAVSGTANAADPQVAPNGSLFWVEGDGASFQLLGRTAGGTTTVYENATDRWFELPRISPEGMVYYLEGSFNDPANPDDDTFAIKRLDGKYTSFGGTRDNSAVGFLGYDVRQPLSTGTSTITGDANPDIIARDSNGDVWTFPMTETAFISSRKKLTGGWNAYISFIAAGDLNADGKGDILAKDKYGDMWFYAGKGANKLTARVKAGTGWLTMGYLAPGDLTGDDVADLVGLTSTGNLYLYKGKGTGVNYTKTLISSGYSGMSAVLGVGDFNFDNTADLVFREKSTGYLYLAPGRGDGTFAARRKIGSGWGGFTALATPEFVGTNPGIYARKSSGQLLFYGSTGNGRFDSGLVFDVGGSWNGYLLTS
jgi:hypothetical protein